MTPLLLTAIPLLAVALIVGTIAHRLNDRRRWVRDETDAELGGWTRRGGRIGRSGT